MTFYGGKNNVSLKSYFSKYMLTIIVMNRNLEFFWKVVTIIEASRHLLDTSNKSPLTSHAMCCFHHRYLPENRCCRWQRRHAFLELCLLAETVHRCVPFALSRSLLFVTPRAEVCCARQINQSHEACLQVLYF